MVNNSLDHLPLDILADVLARLPLRSLLTARCVCKTFLHIINGSNDSSAASTSAASFSYHTLIQLRERYGVDSRWQQRFYFMGHGFDDVRESFHTHMIHNRISELPDPVSDGSRYTEMSSCNGLVYLVNNMMESVLCNPITNEYIKIPYECENDRDYPYSTFSCLGFSPSSNQYKILKVFREVATIFVVGSDDSWRAIKGINKPRSFGSRRMKTQAFLEGVIYLIDDAFRVGPLDFFDFEKEEFGEINLPEDCINHRKCEDVVYKSVGVLQGCVCLLCYYPNYPRCLVMWVLEKSSRNEETNWIWIKKFVVDKAYIPSDCWIMPPMQVMKNGEIFMLGRTSYASNCNMLLYNPRNKSLRYIHVEKEGHWNFIGIADYTPRFICLKNALKVR